VIEHVLIGEILMSPRGSHQKPPLTKAERCISPDDVRWLEIERDRLATSDTRTEAQRWLGDPPAARSALVRHDETTDFVG
jgi:hypothetical protein